MAVRHREDKKNSPSVLDDTHEFGNEGAGDYAEFEDTGFLQFHGDARFYDDLPPVPILVAKLGVSAPTLATFTTNTQLYTFDVNNLCYGATELTHEYDQGTSIYPHLHWVTNGTDIADKAVKWELDYTVQNMDEEAPFTHVFADDLPLTVETVIPANTASLSGIISAFDAISGPLLKIGSYVVWRLKRVTADGDAPTSPPFGVAVGFHVARDTCGSRQQYSK